MRYLIYIALFILVAIAIKISLQNKKDIALLKSSTLTPVNNNMSTNTSAQVIGAPTMPQLTSIEDVLASYLG